MQEIKKNKIIATVLFSFLVSFFIPLFSANAQYPQLANIYLKTPIKDSQVADLAQWDVLVLHMLAQQNSASQIKRIRRLNPDIKILVYIASEEFPISVYDEWDSSPSGLFHKLLSGITDDMWLLDGTGRHVTYWKDFWMLNVSDYSSRKTRWNEYLSDFVADELLSSNLWDGVFYDNVWTGISWINNGAINIDSSGGVDSAENIDRAWQEGMSKIFRLTRQKAGDDVIILGNGDRGFYGELNGLYIENFTDDILPWEERMNLYQKALDNKKPTIVIVGNTNLNEKNSTNYQGMRFGLGSSLMEDGYYAFDAGSNSHAETWWYDEYDVDLGEPIADSASKKGYEEYQPDVWKRDYENGLALVNSTNKVQTIDLGGEYEKIHGIQDPDVNDGSIITETVIDGYDGLILLKTFASLNDVIFTNGEFARFFRANGERARNGFFIFEEGYEGGDQIIRTDLDGNGKRDLVLAHRNKLYAWRDDGQLYMKKYPYGIGYNGTLRIATGDLNLDGRVDVFVAPEEGYPAPIKVYTRHGRQKKMDWYPFGETYDGGYYMAVGNTDGGGNNELVIGTGSGVDPEIYIYNRYYEYIRKWYAFEKQFFGGVRVASGDVDGDGTDEIVVGAGPGKKPVIRIFDQYGNQKFDEFIAYTSFNTPGIDVRTADVDYDGIDEIVGLGSSF